MAPKERESERADKRWQTKSFSIFWISIEYKFFIHLNLTNANLAEKLVSMKFMVETVSGGRKSRIYISMDDNNELFVRWPGTR